MKKKIVGLIAIGLLTTIALSAIPASAYEVRPSTRNSWASQHVIQLEMDGWDDAHSLYYFPGPATDVVIRVAHMYGMSIDRSRSTIKSEIRFHAMAYLNGERAHSNPMDIEMYRASWWTYISD